MIFLKSIFKLKHKSFSTRLAKFLVTESEIPKISQDINYKPLFFNYKGISYRAQIPSSIDQSVNEFLSIFAKERNLNQNTNLSEKDFEIFKGRKYIPYNYLINQIVTKPIDFDPLMIVESQITFDNIKYRDLQHFPDPINNHSPKLHEYINKFLTTYPEKTANKSEIYRVLNSFEDVRGNKSKFYILIISILNNLLQYPDLKVDFLTNQTFDFPNRHSLKDVFIMKSHKNRLNIPITCVLETDDLSFNKGIIENLNTLKNISSKQKIRNNFGIVTNLNKWKFIYYRKPEALNLECPTDFLMSYTYDFFNKTYINEEGIKMIESILKGIACTDKDSFKKVLFTKI